jgi:hypothetical protein
MYSLDLNINFSKKSKASPVYPLFGREIEGSQFESSTGKMLVRPYLSEQDIVLVHAFNTSRMSGEGRKTAVLGWPRQNCETLSET